MKTTSYQDLLVWQKSMKLVKGIYALTETFPPAERFGITSQMQRAAVAIPSNIAEGHLRRHKKEFLQFISISLGSAGELETQLLICQSIDHLNSQSINELLIKTDEIKKMLYSLSIKLEANEKQA